MPPRFPLLALLVLCALCGFAACGQRPAPLPPLIDVKVIGTGSPVVFIPGLAMPGSVWDETVAKIKDQHTCYVVTVAGFGGLPPVPRRPRFLIDVRDALIAYLREHKVERPVFVGHSLGGVIALDIAANAPDLPAALLVVDGLPFFAAMMGPGFQTEAATQRSAERVSSVLAGQTHAQFAERQAKFVVGMVTDPEKARRLATLSCPSDPATSGEAMGELIGRDLRPELGAIRCPVTVLGALAGKIGEGAPVDVVEAGYRQQYANVPQARFEFFETSRHFLMIDDPVGFDAALARVLAGPGR